MTFEPVPDVTGPLVRVRRWLDDRRGPVDLLIAAGLWLFTSAAYLVSYAGLDVGGGELIAYGLAGVRALFGAHMAVAPTLPWGQLAAVALVAVVAGLVASVLPARRAARVSPAQALAAE
ncbi:hypothetical protein [Janibacter anophelis]|uniref:hypothetical protein n=1 Tax=Janibacter anophelis TaxID=319054 RepID=UPI0012EEBA8E|nr:hypothetical protein [Janibacter anophelis]